MQSKVRILGIDPGAKRCGFSIIEFDVDGDCFVNPVFVASGIFGLARLDEETYSQYKARLIKNAIDAFEQRIEDYEPDIVLFEFLPVTNVGAAAGQRLLAFVTSTTGQVVCNMSGIPWWEITAASVKKIMTGQGTASKAQVKRAVLEVFPDLKSNKYLADETDAIAIPLAWTKRKNTTDT
jgi:crossover junction endodeoxyribonuclease RuvC